MNDDKEILILENGVADKHYWKDLWSCRDLFYVLAIRDVSVRYKQTVIGVMWALVKPLITMVVFTVIFGKIAGFSSGKATPYALVVFSGLLPWQLFSSALMDGSNSLIANSNLISKVYFPRMIIPISSLLAVLIDFLISFAILIGLMLWYRFMPSIHLLMLPVFIFMAIFSSLGLGLLFGALNVKYRDFRYLIPFLIQLGLYVSPVGFVSEVVPHKWEFLYCLNPMVGIIDAFRWAILGDMKFNFLSFYTSLIVTFLFMYLGVKQFRSMEKKFADLV